MSSRIARNQFAAIGALMLCAMTAQARPVIRVVTNTSDSGPGSLRQEIIDSQDGDLISFAVALHGQTITLTSTELEIDKNVTLNGPGPDMLTVSRSSNMPFRVLHIMPGRTVTIQGFTISGGSGGYADPGGGILNDHATLTINNCVLGGNGTLNFGGGIYNDGSDGSATLIIVHSAFSFNFSPDGGGIYNDGKGGDAALGIINSSVINNISTNGDPPYDLGFAGGIDNEYGTVMISNSTISDNMASNWGGGIFNGGTLIITNSTVSGNSAGFFGTNNWPGEGGGIYNEGPLTISNSTISGNSARGNAFKGLGLGGGVINYHDSTVALTNSTLTGNSANIGGGVYTSGVLEAANTIFNLGGSGENIFNNGGTVTSHGYNLSSDDGGGYLNGPGDQINTDPLLGTLQDNGGPTLTHALLPGSPAIDAGGPSFTPPPYYDQRGPRFRRIFNGRIDVGAFEVQPEPPPFPTPRPRPTPAPRP